MKYLCHRCLQSYGLFFTLTILAFFGCSGGGGGGGGDNTIDTTKSVTFVGQATIPGDVPDGRLWLVIDGLDGSSYGSGPSDSQGNFAIEVSLPRQSEYVLIYAVDPDDPESYAMAMAAAKTDESGAAARASNNSEFISVNVESTAEVFISMASGLTPDAFTPIEQSLTDELADAFLLEPPKLCSVEQSSIYFGDKLVPHILVRELFDKYVNEEGALILRVKRAQDHATKNVTSLNQATGFRIDEGTAVLTSLSLVRTRAALRLLLGEEFGLQGGLKKETITREELEYAADIIVNPNGITGGYGNCREKGIVGAYIASRFNEFKQVAYVAVETELYSQPHGFAVACQADESVWDINKLLDIWETGVPVPEGLYQADCMIIDPWAGITKELTPEATAGLKWKWIEHVMKVDLSNQNINTNSSDLISLKRDEMEPLDSESVTEYSEINYAICEPFTIPGTDELCDDGVDNDGDGDVDCADSDCDCDVPEYKQYHVFKRSGTGYRKMWGGFAEYRTGYDYFYAYALPSEVSGIIDAWDNFDEATASACESTSPAICPCPPYPDIWTQGSIELVGSFDTIEELDSYRCDTPSYMPYYFICDQWSVDSDPKYWDNINSICGG